MAAGDIVLGEILWVGVSGVLYVTGFLAAMAVLGLITSPWVLMTIPAAFLLALGFGAVGMAATSYMRSWEDSQLVQLFTMPMLLFSTTFFPLTVYPELLRPVVQALPLYQGIELMRALVSGDVVWETLGQCAYFAVMTVMGVFIAVRQINRVLLR